MAFGHTTASSKVRLNYRSLKQAIIAKGNRGHKGQVQCSYNMWAIHDVHTNDIALKLHRTNIITYHPDGTRTLRANGWHTQLTGHWFGEAGVHITNRKINDWSGKVWLYVTPGGTPYKFYDGMRIGERGELLSEPEALTKLVPSTEARDLRKRITQVVKQNYMPHLRLLSLNSDWRDRAKAWGVGIPGDGIKPLIDGEVDPLPTLAYALNRHYRRRGSQSSDPIKVFKQYVTAEYRQHVNRMQLFNVVPFHAEEK